MIGGLNVSIEVDWQRVRDNVARIKQQTGVEVWAVVKADGYGLGAARVAKEIADRVDGLCVFSLGEAVDADLWHISKRPIIALGPPDSLSPGDYLAQHVRPAVVTIEQARALKEADPVLCVDTGMQRFACPAEEIEAVLAAGGCHEAFTHATRLEHVQRLQEFVGHRKLKLHAAASGLLSEPTACLDAVRPGLALYDQAVTVRTRLIEVHASRGPVGYTGFSAAHHAIIPVGYAQGLRPGLCLVGGERRRIFEVGMQSAYIEGHPDDRPGEAVLLLSPRLPPQTLAPLWPATPHEVLLRLAQAASAGSPKPEARNPNQ